MKKTIVAMFILLALSPLLLVEAMQYTYPGMTRGSALQMAGIALMMAWAPLCLALGAFVSHWAGKNSLVPARVKR